MPLLPLFLGLVMGQLARGLMLKLVAMMIDYFLSTHDVN